MKKIAFRARLQAADIPADDIKAIRMEAIPEVAIEVSTTVGISYVYLTGIIPLHLMEDVVRVLQSEPDQEKAAQIIADTLASEVIGPQVRAIVVRK